MTARFSSNQRNTRGHRPRLQPQLLNQIIRTVVAGFRACCPTVRICPRENVGWGDVRPQTDSRAEVVSLQRQPGKTDPSEQPVTTNQRESRFQFRATGSVWVLRSGWQRIGRSDRGDEADAAAVFG